MGAVLTTEDLINLVKSSLTADLLKKEYRDKNKLNPTYGHCYVATESLYYLLIQFGLNDGGYRPHHGRDSNGIVHWWLKNKNGKILDPTVDQYIMVGSIPPYSVGKPGWFLTNKPSKRSKIILTRVLVKLEKAGAAIPQ